MHSSFRRHAAPAAFIIGCIVALSGCADSDGGFLGFGKKPAPVVPPAASAVNTPLVQPTSHSSIPVLVNDVPITDYDINQRLRLERLGGGGKGATVQSVTEELIDETLESIEGQRKGIAIPDAQVDAAFANISEHLKMTPAALAKGLASQGVDASALKARLRAQMLWQTLVQRRTKSKAQISSEQVKAAIGSKGGGDTVKVTEYMLQQIIFVVPSGSPPSAYAQRRVEAQAFRQRFAGCDKSLDQAKLLRGVVVKDIGRHESTELSGPDGDAIAKTPVGSAAPPTQGPEGITLVAVCSSHDIQSMDAARNEATNSLYIKQSADLGKDYLKELRDQAIIERH